MEEKFRDLLPRTGEDGSFYEMKNKFAFQDIGYCYRETSSHDLKEDSLWLSEDPNCKHPSTVLTPFILEECEGRRLTEGIVLEKISIQGQSTVLKLGFELISVIDSLQSFVFLAHLELNNNLIETITGLEALTNLTFLDLSFNKIRAVEGLDNLTNLETLLLFSNRIKDLGGLKQLTNLKELSLGMNCIASYEELGHLCVLERLKILVLAGNPISKGVNYRKNVLDILPSLKVLDEHRETKNAKVNDRRILDDEQEECHIKLSIPETMSFLPKELTNISSYQFFLDPDFENSCIYECMTEYEIKEYFSCISGTFLILKELDDRCQGDRQKLIESFLELVRGIVSSNKEQMATMMSKYIAEANKRMSQVKMGDQSKEFGRWLQNQSKQIDLLESQMKKKEADLSCQIENALKTLRCDLKHLIQDFCESVRMVFGDLVEAESEAVLNRCSPAEWQDGRKRLDLLDSKRGDVCACAASWRLEVGESLVALARAHEITLDSRRFLKEEREKLARLGPAREHRVDSATK